MTMIGASAVAEANVNAPSPVCIDCGGPKHPGKGALCGRCSGKRRNARWAELRAMHEAGEYAPGVHTRDATCKGRGRLFPGTRHHASPTERRVGKECSSTCGSRGSLDNEQNKIHKHHY